MFTNISVLKVLMWLNPGLTLVMLLCNKCVSSNVCMEALLCITPFIDQGGMDIARLLEQELQRSLEGLLQAEAENKLAGGRSTVILFIPHTPVSLSPNDLTIAKNRIKHFREFLPGQYPKMYQCRQVK